MIEEIRHCLLAELPPKFRVFFQLPGLCGRREIVAQAGLDLESESIWLSLEEPFLAGEEFRDAARIGGNDIEAELERLDDREGRIINERWTNDESVIVRFEKFERLRLT